MSAFLVNNTIVYNRGQKKPCLACELEKIIIQRLRQKDKNINAHEIRENVGVAGQFNR